MSAPVNRADDSEVVVERDNNAHDRHGDEGIQLRMARSHIENTLEEQHLAEESRHRRNAGQGNDRHGQDSSQKRRPLAQTRKGADVIALHVVGDGANDLEMMAIAGLSIAFNAKPIVIEAADLSITEPSLSSVPQLMGL